MIRIQGQAMQCAKQCIKKLLHSEKKYDILRIRFGDTVAGSEV